MKRWIIKIGRSSWYSGSKSNGAPFISKDRSKAWPYSSIRFARAAAALLSMKGYKTQVICIEINQQVL